MARGIYTDVRLDALGQPPDPAVKPPATDQALAQPAGASAIQDFAGKGALLEEPDDKKVFRAIDEEVEQQEPMAKNREAARKWRAAVRSNRAFATLKKNEDRSVWEYAPAPGGDETASPIPNKADDLCRKIVSQVIIDVPAPDPKPATDDEKDRGAADLAKRFLKVDGDESGTNDSELFRDVLDSAMTDASAFVHVWVDSQGGGWRPLKIKAHPQAQDPSNPLVGIDPATGQEVPAADYVFRYVNDQGQFVETAAEASRQWMPKICRDVLGPAHVRTVPVTADVANADGVILLMFGPVSDLKRRVPELDDSIVERLANWKPKRAKSLIPEALRAQWKEQVKVKGAAVNGNTLVFWYLKYCASGPDYSDGAEIYVSGADGGLVIRKGTLRKDVQDEDEVQVLLRDVPVSQCKALHDSEFRDPMGKAPIDLFGATNEGLSQLYGAVLEDTDHRLNPHTFIPSTSPVQDWQLADRSRLAIPVYSKDDQPFYEEFADLASFTPQVIEMMESSMRESAMLGSTAQVLDSPNAKSGIAKQVEVSQAKVFLAPVSQNFFAFVKRYWRLKLEAAQAFLTIPQEVEYVGLDQAYKQRWFTGRDFSGVKDVAILAGTGTLMSPVEKQQFLSFAQSAMWLDPEEAGEAGRSSVADDLGLQGSPAEDAIKRELAAWMKGPPEGWMPPQPTMDEIGQQVMSAPSWTPFATRPTDEDPTIAKRQYKILRDFCYTGDYMDQPPEWRSVVDQRIALAMYAAGVQTMRQQAEAQAQEQQAQADQSAQNLDANRSEKAADRDLKREEREHAKSQRVDEMDHEAAMQDRKQAAETQRAALKTPQPA